MVWNRVKEGCSVRGGLERWGVGVRPLFRADCVDYCWARLGLMTGPHYYKAGIVVKTPRPVVRAAQEPCCCHLALWLS